MPIPRFHFPAPLSGKVQVALPDAAARHAARVLRLRHGDRITLFDGGGGEWQASVHAIARDSVVVDVGRHIAVEREAPLHIALGQSLCSGDKMDTVLQKSVQLGIARFQPLATRNSVVRLTETRGERRHLHWQNVALHACEQCGRNRLPEVLPTDDLQAWLQAQSQGDALRLMLAPDGSRRLADLAPSGTAIVVLVGPEAGLTQAEADSAERAGFTPVRLGPRVLRTETAGVTAIAAIQTLWGDLR